MMGEGNVVALRRMGARLRSSIARAVLHLVNDEPRLQAVQVQLQAEVVRDDVEHFQAYGLSSHPHPGAEGIGLAVGGSTDHLVVINVDDRRFRVRSLAPGEVCLYDDLGHKVFLTRAGIVIDGAGHQVTMTNLTRLRVEADVVVTGDITAAGQITDLDGTGGTTMSAMRTAYNAHVHTESGVATLAPDTPM